MIEETSLETYDGLKLYARKDVVANPAAVVVIVHGLAEHLNRYDYLTMRLNAQGYSVYRFDHRGHGRSEGPQCHYNCYEDIVKDCDVAVDWAIEENPGCAVYMIGHSMGGFAATAYATTYPGKIEGYILSGALTRDNGGLMAGALAATEPDMTYVPNELGAGVCSDPEVGEVYAADPLVSKRFTLGLMRNLYQGTIFMKENAKNFTDPVLMMHGLNDGLVSYKDSLESFDEIGSEDKSLRIFSGMMHEIFNEYDKDIVIQTAIDWLNNEAAMVYELSDALYEG